MEIMFIVLCSDISLVLRTREISLYKTILMISIGDPLSPVLVIRSLDGRSLFGGSLDGGITGWRYHWMEYHWMEYH